MRVQSVEVRLVDVGMRMPFRYGIATMTSAVHAVVRVTLDGVHGSVHGTSGENLPPKWFEKDPETSADTDFRRLLASVTSAAISAKGLEGESVFDLWRQLSQLRRDAVGPGEPGLLVGLGVSLMERALIDAQCRASDTTFHAALHDGTLGFDAVLLHPELAGVAAAEALPLAPASRIAVRHTVGLGDQVSGTSDRPYGLPVSLEEVMTEQGVRYLKLKTQGDLGVDIPRLREVLDVADAHGGALFTIDGNESMTTPEHLRVWTRGVLNDPDIGDRIQEGLVAVEQPVHRSVAMDPSMTPVLRELTARVPIVIDESDDWPETVRHAMDLGYSGGTYKGCKGVFRGVANAMLIQARGQHARTLLTAEDLTTLPPYALNQDLAVASALGIEHIERNGHHYFARVVPVGVDVDDRLATAHPDAFHCDADGATRLTIRDGTISTTTINEAPFGLLPEPDLSNTTQLDLSM